MKNTGFSPYIKADICMGLYPLRDVSSVACIPSAAKAGDENQLLTDGLKPVPFNGYGFWTDYKGKSAARFSFCREFEERNMGLVKQKVIHLAVRGAPNPERDSNELLAALEDADAGVRRQAAREIMPCMGAAAALVSRLKREENAAVREVLLSALVRLNAHLNDPLAVSGLAECLRSEDAALRNEVIQAIKGMGSEVEPILQLLLADPDPDVRIFAVNILDPGRHPGVERWLIEIIEREAHVNVCSAAVDLLCEAGTEAAVDPLIRLKARFASEAYIQFASNLALKRIRGV